MWANPLGSRYDLVFHTLKSAFPSVAEILINHYIIITYIRPIVKRFYNRLNSKFDNIFSLLSCAVGIFHKASLILYFHVRKSACAQ